MIAQSLSVIIVLANDPLHVPTTVTFWPFFKAATVSSLSNDILMLFAPYSSTLKCNIWTLSYVSVYIGNCSGQYQFFISVLLVCADGIVLVALVEHLIVYFCCVVGYRW